MATGRPPAPIPQEPADPTARATLELPLLFQPHADLEKTSGSGLLTEQPTSSSQVNGASQSQDSEAAGIEAITAEEPFKDYSFEVCLLASPSPVFFVCCPGGGFTASPSPYGYNPPVLELTSRRTSFLPNLGTNIGTAMLCLYK